MDILYLEVFNVAAALIIFRLGIKQKPLVWPLNIVMTLLSLYVYYHRRLYGIFVASLLFIPLEIYGWYYWKHGGPGKNHLPVTATAPHAWSVLAGVGLLSTLVGRELLHRFYSAQPLLEAARIALIGIGHWLTANKKVESYLIWFTLNSVSLIVFYRHGMYAYAVKYTIYLYLSLQGYWAWRRSYQHRKSGK